MKILAFILVLAFVSSLSTSSLAATKAHAKSIKPGSVKAVKMGHFKVAR